jgi:predicted transcriptional regulator
MTQFVQVEGKSDLVRDMNSGAIVNRNRGAYEIAKRRAEEAQRQRDEIRGATREINTLKCEMHEIKDMLKTIVDRK